MNLWSRVLGVVFVVFFGYASIVQINDEDSLMWVLLYAAATFVSLLFAMGRLKKWMVLILIPLYLALAVIHWPPEFEGVALQDGMKTLNIELARESLGMGMAALVMIFYYIILKRKKID